MTTSSSSPIAHSAYLVARSHLTPRDLILLDWLAHHRALTTPHVTAALFGSERRAQARLAVLRRLRFIDSTMLRPSLARSAPYLHTLGPFGHQWAAARRDEPPPTARQWRRQAHAIIDSPFLGHQLGVNSFFIALAAHSRTHRHARLRHWLNQAQAAQLTSGVRPDGFGRWHVGDRDIGFFFEYDTGEEELHRLVTKVRTYALAVDLVDTARWPVVFWLHSRRREANLHQRLTDEGVSHPVATGVHADNPANSCLFLVGSDPARRIPLIALARPDGR
ncbi:replication-relaxation family protein [Catellatospora paridis]|uniref:replication-relaxation family protein n=1 Tax=Catellatospora paridis TaxID=1617086 RepID=UPI0012D38D80|nr:replication-relaxation family protein [Catellatospora paridis]